MTLIEIKTERVILLDREHLNKEEKNISFLLTLSEQSKASVCINFVSKSLEMNINNYSVSDEFVSNENSDFDSLPKNLQKEIANIKSQLASLVVNVMSLIKYHCGLDYISEQLFSIKSTQWRRENQDWKNFPLSIHLGNVQILSYPRFDDKECQAIQESLDENIIPLLGMRHLHKAQNESMPHHKWIDATIAAELSIKEALIIAKPNLETLLLEVPSPPLTKLYGSILETYLGERSPFLSIIREGVRIRNKLVHSPSTEKVDGQKAIDYVHDIERVIFHLLLLLYPQNRLIQSRTRMMGICANKG